MSKLFHKSFMALSAGAFILAAGTVVTAVSVPSAWAQDDEEENTNQSLSTAVATEVQKAYILASEEEKFAEAITVLDRLLANRSGGMTPYELGTTYELRASFKANLPNPNYTSILEDLERAAASGGLPTDRVRQIRFNMAQIYFQEERYPEAIRLLTEYIQYQESVGEPVNANTYRLLAGAYIAQDNFQQALGPMETALRLHRQENNPQQSYYATMNYVYSELKLESKRGDLLVEMINIWPEEEQYWSQLAGAYSQAERDADAAAVLELAYRAGIITESAKVLNLVQYFTILDNPYRGAQLLEQEMAAGNLERDLDNLQLLAQAYNLAREQKKALVPLREAAQIAPTGELYYRLGQILFADEQWQESAEALTEAINRGGLEARDIGDAWLLIGNAYYNIDTNSEAQRDRAIDAWNRAQNYSNSRQAANGWISYVREVRRVEQNQDRVERLQREEAYKNERRRCTTNLEIFERLGNSSGFSESDAERCRTILAAEWRNGQIVLADGTTVVAVEDIE
ncbi:tetratricopeptide repeat protein [Parvularcula flava]|uniref:Tetratricopeptide repeat protein n=1 Tax=Aquisalinus luteolus TaxID=1566827 RepID=A0A8J3ES68_9PROT|nr:tetratricopeptide repeat protein [Aquisalinus luteolus]NHK29552.1 tetratricopeptide repeat protein [Aquisalinus luteolus]GGI01595.1 hypothetical protein GCM10011355_32620 [Aquisalinus luteolus]